MGPDSSHIRSFGGCYTCRARHIRCDQTRPICSNCAKDCRQCDGYEKRIFFASENGLSKDDTGSLMTRHRQLLFEDSERQHMTMQMTSDVALKDAAQVVLAIEAECEAATDMTRTIDIQRGPFGAFFFPLEAPQEDTASSTAPRQASLNRELWDLTFTDLHTMLDESPTHNESSQLVDSMPLSDIGEDDVAAVADNTSPTQHSQTMSDLEVAIGRDPTASDFSGMDDQMLCIFDFGAMYFSDASRLLKHYAESVIPSLTPLRHQKTPWHVTFLPTAMITLSTLAMGSLADAASLTNFYGILAISALDLRDQSEEEKWTGQAAVWAEHAHKQARTTLAHAFDVPKTFKYKPLLMAILTMAQLSVSQGVVSETEAWLLEAERIIRLRGLVKTSKSRKVRMLHHCYTYLRVFHESLWAPCVPSAKRKTMMDSIRRHRAIIEGEDHPSFRVESWGDLDSQFCASKDVKHGENDLHISLPGLWSGTLYLNIFGIPESWLTLMSQVIRLCNEKELATETVEGSTITLAQLSNYAKALEHRILEWEGLASYASQHDATAFEADATILCSMLSALRHGLAIYFYRRFHNIHPEILQSHVEKVRECLEACLTGPDHTSLSLQSLLWSAFVAGCEAISEDLQAYFSSWFSQVISRNRNCLAARLRDSMHQAWEHKKSNPACSFFCVHLRTTIEGSWANA